MTAMAPSLTGALPSVGSSAARFTLGAANGPRPRPAAPSRNARQLSADSGFDESGEPGSAGALRRSAHPCRRDRPRMGAARLDGGSGGAAWPSEAFGADAEGRRRPIAPGADAVESVLFAPRSGGGGVIAAGRAGGWWRLREPPASSRAEARWSRAAGGAAAAGARGGGAGIERGSTWTGAGRRLGRRRTSDQLAIRAERDGLHLLRLPGRRLRRGGL